MCAIVPFRVDIVRYIRQVVYYVLIGIIVISIILDIAIYWNRNLANQIIYLELLYFLFSSCIILNHLRVENLDINNLMLNVTMFCIYYTDTSG